MAQKSIDERKQDLVEFGGDVVTILVKKHNLNPFDKEVVEALVDAYRYGAMKAFEMGREIIKEPVDINIDNLTF